MMLTVRVAEISFVFSVPPHITKDQHEYIVIVNNPIQIPCEVQGIPPPDVSWKKGKTPITKSKPDMTILPNGALRFSSVQVSDGGMYECVASSMAGNDSKSITLIVQGKVLKLTAMLYIDEINMPRWETKYQYLYLKQG